MGGYAGEPDRYQLFVKKTFNRCQRPCAIRSNHHYRLPVLGVWGQFTDKLRPRLDLADPTPPRRLLVAHTCSVLPLPAICNGISAYQAGLRVGLGRWRDLGAVTGWFCEAHSCPQPQSGRLLIDISLLIYYRWQSVEQRCLGAATKRGIECHLN